MTYCSPEASRCSGSCSPSKRASAARPSCCSRSSPTVSRARSSIARSLWPAPRSLSTGRHWQADLKTDQSGRFGAELWSPDDYMVMVEAPELAQPYLIMERARPSDSHWRLTIPSRRIAGRTSSTPRAERASPTYNCWSSRRAARREPTGVSIRKRTARSNTRAPATGQYVLSASAPEYLPGERVELQAPRGRRRPPRSTYLCSAACRSESRPSTRAAPRSPARPW